MCAHRVDFVGGGRRRGAAEDGADVDRVTQEAGAREVATRQRHTEGSGGAGASLARVEQAGRARDGVLSLQRSLAPAALVVRGLRLFFFAFEVEAGVAVQTVVEA